MRNRTVRTDREGDYRTEEEVGYNAMYELLNSGKLKGYKNGRTWRIPRTALAQHLLENAKITQI